ncbi:GFA family protein [Thioclava sp. GXIMD4216]|uniref:GFA family protein n=1 Tax=Thioclava litoralis TaxID=3076557 RepID=A0ABZ1E385_9RHOB|nr:GFA family protein [Thioclava sp. FTW29]
MIIDQNAPQTVSCHCGAVKLQIRLADGLRTARRCDCSFCRRRGAAAVTVKLEDLEITQGEENLTVYQFNTKTAVHYFCKTCGIYTHHRRRSDPTQYGVNLGAIEGVNPRDWEPVKWVDGVSHPSDR